MRAVVFALAGLLVAGCTGDNPEFQQRDEETDEGGSSTSGVGSAESDTAFEDGDVCDAPYFDEGGPFQITVHSLSVGVPCPSNTGSATVSAGDAAGEYVVDFCTLSLEGGCDACEINASFYLSIAPIAIAPILDDGACHGVAYLQRDTPDGCEFDFLQLFEEGENRPLYTASGADELHEEAPFHINTAKVWIPDQCPCEASPIAECCGVDPGGYAIAFDDLEDPQGEVPVIPTGGLGTGTANQNGPNLEYALIVPRAFFPLTCDERPTFQWVASALILP